MAGASPLAPEREPGPEQLPQSFWLILRGVDVAPPTHPVQVPSKVVLLHGWLQDHTSWLTTAHKLRATYGHDVLLLDFYGHGRSPFLPNFLHMNIHTCVRQLRELLEHVGWAHAPLVLAGVSFGGGVAQHYVLRHPENVSRMILLASVGSPEPTWRPVPMVTRASIVLVRWLLFPHALEKYTAPDKCTPLNNLRGKLWIARKYPDHGLPQEMPHFLRRYPLTLVWGRYDTLHSPNLRRWMCKDVHTREASDPETGRGADSLSTVRNPGPRTDVNVLLVPMVHELFCVSLDGMKLHRYPHFWHDHPSPSAARKHQLASKL